MWKIYQKNKIIIAISIMLFLTSCVNRGNYGDKLPVQGKILILSNLAGDTCFRPDFKSINYNKVNKEELKIFRVSYHIYSINNLPSETVKKLNDIAQNGTGEKKREAIIQLGTNNKLIWNATPLNHEKIFQNIEPICIGKYDKNFKQESYEKLQNGKEYTVGMIAITHDLSDRLYFTSTFTYSVN